MDVPGDPRGLVLHRTSCPLFSDRVSSRSLSSEEDNQREKVVLYKS